jgi:4-hydroxyphenylacetate 3-monooxygenase
MARHPEQLVRGKKRPFNAVEYLEALRDGREVYIYGERVDDVTEHPAFRNAAVSVAKLYIGLHDTKRPDYGSDTGSGGHMHRFLKAAAARAAFLNTLGANAEFYGKFADHARLACPAARRRCSTSTRRWSIRRSIAAILPSK